MNTYIMYIDRASKYQYNNEFCDTVHNSCLIKVLFKFLGSCDRASLM